MENQLRQDDHDAIVTLTATSKVGFADMKADIADLKTVIAEFKGNFNLQYNSLDSRVKIIENLAIQSNPTESLKKLQKHEDFINDYISTHKERTSLWGFWVANASILIAAGSLVLNFIKK